MSSSELSCVFCKELFDNKDDLQIHFRKHGDPKFNDSSSSNDKNNENNEVVKCDVCMEEFPTISKAITHKHKIHPEHDTKYFCSWCGKLFTMKHLYNKHVQSSHSSEENSKSNKFHCDSCDVDFHLATAMVYHNKFFHRQDTLADIGQSKKVQKFNEEILLLYYCPFCGEEYSNKVNLHKHINDDHNDENQSPDEILRCPLCEAIFFHLDAYEVHLTYHSTEDSYSHENEIVKQVVDFSLEAVPPLMEQVENCEPEDADSSVPVDFAHFLQQALNESNENDDSSNSEITGKKAKKHKKHKKSKKDKSAITLDEFLNMNQDVFGEGLDFQGIEEVPTRAVAKHLKKPSAKANNPKVKQLSELEKLKKQGIVVKMKSKNNLGTMKLQGMKVRTKNDAQNFVQNQMKGEQIKKTTCSSNEVLSKLMNQGNSQLKIVKKTSQDLPKSNSSNSATSSNNTKEDSNIEPENCLKDTKDAELQLNNATKDVTVDENDPNKLLDKESPTEMTDKNTSQEIDINKVSHKLGNAEIDINRDSHILGNANDKNEENYDVSKFNQEPSLNNELLDKADKKVDQNYLKNSAQEYSNNPKNSTPTIALNPFKSLSQQITIKSLSSKNAIGENKVCNESDTYEIQKSVDDKSTKSLLDKKSKTSIDTLKYLSHLTVKPVNSKMNEVSESENIKHKNPLEEKKFEPKIGHDQDKSQDSELKELSETSKTIQALIHLGKHITVKSPQIKEMSNTTNTYDSEEDHENSSEEEPVDDITDFNLKNVKTEKTSNYSMISTVHSEGKKSINVLNRLANITAKPVAIKPQLNTTDIKPENPSIKSDNQYVNTVQNEEIEIYNIEDSDDEEMNIKSSNSMDVIKNTFQDTSNSSANILKNLCKSITVKSANPKNGSTENNNLSDHIIRQDVVSSVSETVSSENKQTNPLNMNSKSMTVKTTKNIDEIVCKMLNTSNKNIKEENNILEGNTQISSKSGVTQDSGNNSMKILKNLSKNITIKSNTPCIGMMDRDGNSELSRKICSPKTMGNQLNEDVIPNNKNNTINKNTEHQSRTNFQQKDKNIKEGNNSTNTTEKIMKPVLNKTFDTLRNISKNITIKSSKSQDEEIDDDIDEIENEFNNESISMNYQATTSIHHSIKPIEHLKNIGKDIVIKSNKSNFNQIVDESREDEVHNNKTDNNNTALQNKLLQLSKNITVKSKNSFSKNVSNRKLLDGFDSDSDSSAKGIKITEMEDDDNNTSGDENHKKSGKQSGPNNMVIALPPHSKHSDYEAFDESDEDFDDIESEIKINKLNNPQSQASSYKTLHCDHESKTNNLSQLDKSMFPGLNNSALSIKPIKSAPQSCSLNKNSQGTKSVSQSNIHRSSTSSDTVSKEVSVKTFQSKTVIEEITTTVTKTIRTVNQTVKQEVQHSNQSNLCFKTPVRPLKVQGMPTSNQRIKNYQGVTVRQAAPTGPRIRNPIITNRPIRPSNQLVPMPPSVNTRPIRPSASPGNSNLRPKHKFMGTPLKISPHVLVASTTKPKEESKGHFSCFKKPKESLIPEPDLCSTSSASPNQGESSVHYAAKQINRSSFNSTTKVIKGNSVATSVQSTSQMCARSEQISRLNSMSGLKVVKTSQSKQAMHVEEQRDGSATKRTTLDAIEKLQKQGLLVKKPRLDEDHFSEHSDSDGEFDDI